MHLISKPNPAPPRKTSYADEYVTEKEDEEKITKPLLSFSDSNSERDNINPVNPLKFPNIAPSTSFSINPTKELQVLDPTSRFAHVNVYSSGTDDLVNLFDYSNDSNEDRQRTLDGLVKKNKRKRRSLLRVVKKLNISLDKERASFKKRPTNPLETAKQDLADQKKMTEQTGIDSLHMFCKDLCTEALARRGWISLLTIQLADGNEVPILDNYMLLGKDDLKSANCAQSSDH